MTLADLPDLADDKIGGQPVAYTEWNLVAAVVNFLKARTLVVSNIADLQPTLNAANGRPVHLVRATHTVAAPIVLPTNTLLTCDPGAVLRAADGMNDHILTNTAGASRITVRGLIIDGNAANQADDVASSGLYMLDVGALLIEDVQVRDVKGHGIHLSNDAAGAVNQRINRCLVERSGSTDTSAYGSGIAVTNGSDLVISSCKSKDNKRAGYRLQSLGAEGIIVNDCVAVGNGDGGLVPVSGSTGLTVNGGRYIDNGEDGEGDGIRVLGTTDMTITGVTSSGNAGAGLGVYNSAGRITVTGGQMHNNGQSADPVTELTGRSGVVIKHNGGAPVDITITGVDLDDTQATKTQDYGVEVHGTPTGVHLTGNKFGTHKTSALLDLSTAGGVTVDATNRGLSCQARDFEDVTLTGSTTSTLLREVTIEAGELGRLRGVRLRMSGTTAGTAGTKQVRFAVNGSGTLVLNQVATTPGAFTVEVDVWRRTSGVIKWISRLGQGSGHSTSYGTVASTHDTTDLVLGFSGQLGVGTDTITAAMWHVESIL